MKKRRGFHRYKPEKVTTTESMHMQDREELDLSLSVGKQRNNLL